MKRSAKRFALFLSAVLLFSALPFPAVAAGSTLNVMTGTMTGRFSPFFSDVAEDQDVWAMTQVNLLSLDREGAVVLRGASGETREHNGKAYTYYGPADVEVTEENKTLTLDIRLRKDILFSDGRPLTADDVIFSMYVLADPAYKGPYDFRTLPIEGLSKYRSAYTEIAEMMYMANRLGYEKNKYFTVDQQYTFEAAFRTAGLRLVDEICDFLVRYGYAAPDTPVNKLAALWGYRLPSDADKEAFWGEISYAHRYGKLSVLDEESVYTPFSELLDAALGDQVDLCRKFVPVGDSAKSISGIRKIDDYTVRVVMDRIQADAVYRLCIPIAPLHYYGSREKFDPKKNLFGFEKGDLRTVRAKNGSPMGAGPYKFVSFRNGKALFTANAGYYRGAPGVRDVCFYSGGTEDPVEAVRSGKADIAFPAYTVGDFERIRKINGLPAGVTDVSGKNIAVKTVYAPSYGYVGFSAERVRVAAPDDARSKNLRKAIATVLSVFREESVRSYYGSTAKVIEYPVSEASWAAPHPGDGEFRAAFSKDVAGKDIYTEGMTHDERVAAALKASLGFFKAAGYVVKGGKVTASPPDGSWANMDVTISIPAGGVGDHPLYKMAVLASEALKKIGFGFHVKDMRDTSQFFDLIERDEVDMWCAAWSTPANPDPFQIYFSGVDVYSPGSSNDMLKISDPALDALILQARETTDVSVRKSLYRQCRDIIADWAVEIPAYQRLNALIFNPKRIAPASFGDITTFYGWICEIETLAFADGAFAKQKGDWIYAAPGLTAETVLSAVKNGAEILDRGGKALNAGDIVGSGMTLVKADGSQWTVVVRGDNDGDGKITTKDARYALRVAVGLETPNALQFAASRVTNGETVGTGDARQILRAAIGLEILSVA